MVICVFLIQARHWLGELGERVHYDMLFQIFEEIPEILIWFCDWLKVSSL